MRWATMVVAVLACCGCQGGRSEVPAGAEALAPTAALAGRVWARSDSTGLPGVMLIFLDDGTLVMDSCWETYQLAKWRAESDSALTWQEGGAEVRATVLQLAAEVLVLRVDLPGGGQTQHFQAASVPYLCPDLPR